ncbi:MAG: hypothetical protein ACRELY_32920 [Polyangiaceae bacterium]
MSLAAITASACADPRGNDPNAPDNAGALAAADASFAAGCTATLPHGCPEAPSYKTDIAPLVDRACNGCHAPGGVASDRDLTSYKNLRKLETTALVQVQDCAMPPADAGTDASLTSSERTEILQWFVCGAPDN